MSKSGPKVIVALDVDTKDEACRLIEELKEDIDLFKVGSQLFTACGPDIVNYIHDQGKQVFLDLKLHDIPNTVANAVKVITKLKVFMATLHIDGGVPMMEAAVAAAKQTVDNNGDRPPLLVGITVLTSEQKQDSIYELILQKSRLAKQSGLNGVVASAQEARSIREEMGDDFVIVTPGIRPKDSSVNDQKRVMTPAQAALNGCNFLVVGRPIVQAEQPREAAKAILKEIELSLEQA